MKVVTATFVSALPALALALSSGSTLESPRDGFLHDVLQSKSADQQYCKPTGLIQDACCDFETVESVNTDVFTSLHELVRTPYFRFHKVDLYRECPFWQEDGSCMNRACGVETTDEEHIPEAWRSHKLGELTTTVPINEDSPAGCDVDDSDFCVLEDELDSEGVYVDLIENPERFTGYAGDSSSRVWKAIYEENCFTPVPFIDPARPKSEGGSGFAPLSSFGGTGPLSGGLNAGAFGENEKKLFGSLAGPRDGGDEVCLEKRVFYRLISGLHASISIHICDDYLDQTTGQWAPNLQCFITRIAQNPERLQNVYFTYVVALRALSKAGPQLVEALEATSSDGGISNGTKARLEDLIQRSQACPSTFDETSMFMGVSAEIMKTEFKSHFRNVSRIMDCVGCDKCRLWGKLQVTGLGTALKLLFSTDSSPSSPSPLLISRGELVSFVNVLHRLSESLAAVDRFRTLWAQRDAVATPALHPPPPPIISETAPPPPLSETAPPPPPPISLPLSQQSPIPPPIPKPAFSDLPLKNPRAPPPPPEAKEDKPTTQGSPVPRTSATSGREEQEQEQEGVIEWIKGVCRAGVSSCWDAVSRGGEKDRVEL